MGSMTQNMLDEVNKECGQPRSKEFSTIYIKLQNIKFPLDSGSLPFRVNLIDSCFMTIPLLYVQNACLVVSFRFSHVLLPKDLTMSSTLHIHQLEFAFISQEYLLNIMHSLPLSFQLGCLVLHWLETQEGFSCAQHSAPCSLHVNSPRSQKLCSLCYFDLVVLQQE